MVNEKMLSMFRMVCCAPEGSGVAIEHMPELIDHDLVSNTQPHTHTFYEILWFQEDGGTHTIDFKAYPVHKNTLVFLAPGQVHHFDGVHHPRGYSIKICSEFCGKYFSNTSAGNDALLHSLFYAPTSSCAELDAAMEDRLERLICRIEEEQHNIAEPHHREMLCLLTRMLMITTYRYSRREHAIGVEHSSAQQQLYVRFRALLEREFMHLHLVSDYAARLSVSTKTLTLAVRACTGQTPLQMIDDRLVLEAKRLLRLSDLMVKEIAYHLGFDSPSNFVKFFRRHTGFQPGEYQRQ